MATTFEQSVRRHAGLVLRGTLLALDPSSAGSSLPGWALYKHGELVSSGVIKAAGGSIQVRLRRIYEALQGVKPDVVAIEAIRGGKRTHVFLLWSVGVMVAATNPLALIEVSPSTWKKFAGPTHEKGDREDAVAIGACVVKQAEGVR